MRAIKGYARALGFGVLLLALSACAGHETPREEFYFPLDRGGWKLANQGGVPGLHRILEFVRTDESLPDWTEIVTVQSYAGKPTGVPRDDLAVLKSASDRICPAATEWSVIEEHSTTLIYEVRTTATCHGHPPQHEIGKILYGNSARMVVFYAKRKERLEPAERRTWLDLLRKTTFRPGKSPGQTAREAAGRIGTLLPFILLPHQ